MLYQKKAIVAAAVFKNGTSSIPERHVGQLQTTTTNPTGIPFIRGHA